MFSALSKQWSHDATKKELCSLHCPSSSHMMQQKKSYVSALSKQWPHDATKEELSSLRCPSSSHMMKQNKSYVLCTVQAVAT
jgi:uncharacterized C2H2 Zn-finger protein